MFFYYKFNLIIIKIKFYENKKVKIFNNISKIIKFKYIIVFLFFILVNLINFVLDFFYLF